MMEITFRDQRAISRPPPSPTRPPVLGEEYRNARGLTATWNGRYWTAVEAQVLVDRVFEMVQPRIMRPGDNRPQTNLPPTPGDLFWDTVGLQLYCWHDDGVTAEWMVTGNTATGLSQVEADQISIVGFGTPGSPLYAELIAGDLY
jgi:hypothetical protein